MYILDEEFENSNDFQDFTEKQSTPSEIIAPSRITFPDLSSSKRQTKSKTQQPLRKKHSRMSLRFEKYKDKLTLGEEETNYRTSIGSNEETIPQHIHPTQISPALSSISINCVLSEDLIKTITLQTSADTTICNIIEKAISEFNKEFSNDKAKIKIKDDSDLFVLKPAKKNGKPKVDMPYFNKDISLSTTQTSNFALCWKEDPDDYIKMYEKVKSKTCEAGCCLF